MIVAMLSLALAPPDYLTTVQSEVIEAHGSPAEIAARGEACMAQYLGSGVQGGELIVSRDPAAGVVVSRNSVSYRDGLLEWQMRSRLTLEAREGRFRLTHTGIERFNDQGGGWSAVGKWWGSGWQKAETALKDVSAAVADCITGSPAARDDW